MLRWAWLDRIWILLIPLLSLRSPRWPRSLLNTYGSSGQPLHPSHVLLVALPPSLTLLFPPALFRLDHLHPKAFILHLHHPCLLAPPSPPIPALPFIIYRELGPNSRPGKQLHPALLDGEVRQHLYLPWLPECASVVYHRPSRAFLHSWTRL